MEIPEGFVEDAKGRLIHQDTMREEDVAEDAIVRGLIEEADQISLTLAAFKEKALGQVQALLAELHAKWGVEKGGAKGNVTLRSYDGRLELEVKVSDRIDLGPELQAAKVLIDKCLTRWTEGSRAELQTFVLQAFEVDKEGKLNVQAILGLRRLRIEDDEWQKAMDAISAAIRVTTSKTYLRLYRRDRDTDTRTPISLNIAAV